MKRDSDLERHLLHVPVMKRFLVLGIAGVAFAMCAAAAEIDANAIIRRSVAETLADWKHAPDYAFVEHDITSKKDGPKSSKTYETIMIDGSPYQKLIADNGQPLSKEEQAAEDQKLQQEINRRAHESKRERARRVGKYLRERTQNHAMLREMINAFNFKLAGEETVNGRDAYIFDALPKPGYQPKTREGRVLTGMRGRLWVDKATDQWVKVEARVVRPVSMYGFLAKVSPGTRFELECAPVAGGLWLPKHFAVDVNATALGFFNENSTDDETYSNYRPMNKDVLAELTGGGR